MPMLDRDGVAIYYEVHGAGPALILTHGFAASAEMFAKVVGPLSEAHTVITWDQRGHGRSDYPNRSGVVLAGSRRRRHRRPARHRRRRLSGGRWALARRLSVVEFLLAHPARTMGLVLIGSGPGFRRDEGRNGWNDYADKIAASYERKGLAALADSEELDASVFRDASGLVLAARHVLKQHDGRVMESLPSITVPTLVLVGADDAEFLGSSQYMAGKIPGAELAVIEGAAHAPPVSQPAAFSDAVLGFLSSNGW